MSAGRVLCRDPRPRTSRSPAARTPPTAIAWKRSAFITNRFRRRCPRASPAPSRPTACRRNAATIFLACRPSRTSASTERSIWFARSTPTAVTATSRSHRTADSHSTFRCTTDRACTRSSCGSRRKTSEARSLRATSPSASTNRRTPTLERVRQDVIAERRTNKRKRGGFPITQADADTVTAHQSTYDAIIIGGGPAGLTCAIFLARYRRRVLIIDNGKPRNYASRGIHGFLGQHDIKPGELIARGRAEAKTVGVEF